MTLRLNSGVFVFISIFLLSLSTRALPKAIILLRHGEKPATKLNASLSERGQERAEALPRIFKENKTLKKLGAPDFLFAAGLKKMTSALRSIETLLYVAKTYKLKVNQSYIRDDFGNLIKDLNTNPAYENKVIVICWEHKILRYFVKGFGVETKHKYPSDAFDRIFLITFDKNKKAVFTDMPQKILKGDSSK